MTPQLFPERQNHSDQRHVITIGNFDGVHLGHQHLIDAVVSSARSRQVHSAVLTFDPLPLEILRPDASLPRLNTSEDRFALIRALGVDDVVPIRFTREVASLEPSEFVRQVVEAFRPVEIIVGADFAFGHNRSGNPTVLRDLGRKHDYVVRIIDRIGDDQTDYSSSRVRACLSTGDVRHAAGLLGRPYFVRGVVAEGKRRGRELGFPTANLAISGNLAIPNDGIYAALTSIRHSNDLMPSMVYVGTSPTFDGQARAVEVNLLHFDRDLYGEDLTVLFVDRVRGDQRFDSSQALVDQMHRDQQVTEGMLAALDDDWPGDVLRAIVEIGKGALTGDH